MHPKKAAAVLAMNGQERFGYFVRKVADSEILWILSAEDGWATAHDGSVGESLPVWPERAFAELCAVGEWSKYTPTSIPLATFLDQLAFEQRSPRCVVFPTPSAKGVFVDTETLLAALRDEASQYE